MAKIRIGFSTHFEVENELVGIGTDNPTNTKQVLGNICLLYTSPSPRDRTRSRMPSSA